MRKFILLLMLSGFLVGCHMYRPDIQQGNVIAPKQAAQLRIGMQKETVQRFLGKPILVNTFARNRLNYIYTYQHGNSPIAEQQLILTFKNNRLINIAKRNK